MAILPIKLRSGRTHQVFCDTRFDNLNPYIQRNGDNIYLKGNDKKNALEMFDGCKKASEKLASKY